MYAPTTLLYTLMGTFMTLLTLFALVDPDAEPCPALHVPTSSS